jgi:hypothetical protein
MLLIVPTLLLLPFALEAATRVGFRRPAVRRHALFYLAVPLTSALVFITLALLLGHPIIAFLGWLMIYLGLTAVSNVKNRVLGEPLDSPDLETARHLFIYPEFYIDYVGAGRVAAVFGGFGLAVALSFWLETPVMAHQSLLPVWAAWPLALLLWVMFMTGLAITLARLLPDARARRLGLTYDVCTDVVRFGLFPLMVLYAVLLLDRSSLKGLDATRPALTHDGPLPDLIAIQAESYLDVDRLYRRIDGFGDHRWQALDSLRARGAATGELDVPAWGASTMQSEFAFQSGIANDALGVDRINPYQRAAYCDIQTTAKRLKAMGYRTICLHPAKKEFFRRATVIPRLGFDQFIGLEAFDGAARFGPYVSDRALGDKIESVIREHKATSDTPLFIFTITIESHGPWEPGRLAHWMDEAAATAADPTGDTGFALFRRHMDNALALFDRLGPSAKVADRPRALALYGDHQPAFQPLFSRFGFEERSVDYILWRSTGTATAPSRLRVEDLAGQLLNIAGFREKQ